MDIRTNDLDRTVDDVFLSVALGRKSGEVKYPEIMKALLDNCN